MSAPTEAKVKASSVGAAVGGAVATFALWLLGCVLWGAPWDADAADVAILAVPSPVAALVVLGVPAGVAYAAGWRARHTPRGPGEHVAP
jgi:hypothetical protein